MYEIILASQSPRRRHLLEEAGYKFQVHPVKVSENIEENLNPTAFAEALSERKALHFLDTVKSLKFEEKLIITADTVVAIDSRVLGKPENFDQAFEFLRLLSGKTHSVITAVTAVPDGQWSSHVTTSVETEVHFRELEDSDIQTYIDSGEPMDKAGAYAIQGEGGKFVRQFEGSWSNVVGLPMEKLEQLFQENHWNVHRQQS